MSCVIVGVDGSPNSAMAVERAVELASVSGARVVAVHGIGLLTRLSPEVDPVPAEASHDELEKLFQEEWCAGLRDSGVPYTSELVAGDAVTALLSVCDREDAWITVVGMRGHRPYGDGPLGSTSLELVFRASRPVLVVPPLRST